jgi:hypothetical protein
MTCIDTSDRGCRCDSRSPALLNWSPVPLSVGPLQARRGSPSGARELCAESVRDAQSLTALPELTSGPVAAGQKLSQVNRTLFASLKVGRHVLRYFQTVIRLEHLLRECYLVLEECHQHT